MVVLKHEPSVHALGGRTVVKHQVQPGEAGFLQLVLEQPHIAPRLLLSQPADHSGQQHVGDRLERADATRPPPAQNRSMASVASSARSRSSRAWARTSRPNAVSWTRRGPPGRSNNRPPTERSSAAICWLSDDWV